MVEQVAAEYADISPQKIEDLLAIYNDYLYMARIHEELWAVGDIDGMAFAMVRHMYPECKSPRHFTIPWLVTKLDKDEKQEFIELSKNNIWGDGKKTYVFLQHVKAEENNVRAPMFAIPPYTNYCINMQMPSMIEQCSLTFPEGVTIGDTEFYVDGRYKVSYKGEKLKNKTIRECVTDPDLLTEITLMLSLSERFRQNDYKDDLKFGRKAVNVYAEELLTTNENNLLEILGLFAEKIKDICHEKYHEKNTGNDIKRAKQDGFLNLPENFEEYINIRNFIRHQWDTLDDLDSFTLQGSVKNKQKRAERVSSYLKFYDKSIYQRMITGIKILQQMQQIICAIKPNRLVREISESKSKFMERVKAACRQNPDKQIEVEMNYPLTSKEYASLNKILHKQKIFPNIKIVDEFVDRDASFARMEDYKKRSYFLQNFHTLECYAMGHCQIRGKSKDHREAWDYLQKIGLISAEECRKWQEYTDLRNKLGHNYFGDNLRKQINDIEAGYSADAQAMIKKIYAASPKVKKLQDNVFEFTHIDGYVAAINFNTLEVLYESKPVSKSLPTKAKTALKNTEYKADGKSCRETYRNGVEFNIRDGKMYGIKLPNGVYIDMNKQSIHWGKKTHWYTNARSFNVLQTDKSMVQTNKNLRVTQYCKENRRQYFSNGNTLMLDNRHSLLLDVTGCIKEFAYKDDENNVVKSKFRLTKDGDDILLFADGTSVLWSAKNMFVIHGNKVLSYDNRKEFAATYDTSISPQQSIKRGNGRL